MKRPKVQVRVSFKINPTGLNLVRGHLSNYLTLNAGHIKPDREDAFVEIANLLQTISEAVTRKLERGKRGKTQIK